MPAPSIAGYAANCLRAPFSSVNEPCTRPAATYSSTSFSSPPAEVSSALAPGSVVAVTSTGPPNQTAIPAGSPRPSQT